MVCLTTKNENESQISCNKLGKVLQKLSMRREDLKSALFSISTAKVLHNSLIYIQNDVNLQKVVVEKFMLFTEFALNQAKDEEMLEIFCNLSYYTLTAKNLEESLKLQIVNHFFTLDGHHKLLKLILNQKTQIAIEVKLLVLLAEIVNIFLTFLSRSFGCGGVWKKKSYEIVFKGTRMSREKITAEETSLYIFEKFVDFMWRKKVFDECEVLSNTSMILAASKDIDPTFFHMLLTLHTSTFVHIKLFPNALLKISANAALRSIKAISAVDLKFLVWWREMGKPDKKLFDQVAMNFLEQSKLSGIESHEARIFDR